MLPLLYLGILTGVMWMLVFLCYRQRKQLTLIPLYSLIAISMFSAQYLSNPGFAVTFGSLQFVIGSVAFFTSVMFGVLILYLLEGPRAARLAFWVIIYTTLLYDVSLFLLNQITDNLVPWTFKTLELDFWSLLAVSIDVVFMAIFWELLAKVNRIPLILRVFLVIFGTFAIDSLVFVSGAFGGLPSYWPIMQSNVWVRIILALVSTPFITIYLKAEGFTENKRQKPKKLWEILNFRSDLEIRIRSIEEVLKSEAMLAQDLKKYKMAVESANDHIVITDADGIILFANKGVEKITGFTREEIMRKKAGIAQLWGGLMPKDFYTRMWKTIKEEKKPFSGEITNHKKSGEKYISMATVSPVLDEHGKVVFFIGLERDISKEKEVDRMKTEFVSFVTHQLRTPITSVQWSLESLADIGTYTDEQNNLLRDAIEANAHMNELVNMLLNISRIESGRLGINPKSADLKDLCEEVKKELYPMMTKKHISIEISSTYDKPIQIDVGMIREVYKNLLTNAIKYSAADTIVSVRIESQDDTVVIRVADTGIGIPDDEQTRVFDKFFRASNTAENKSEGTGLGLYLTKQLIDASGGKIGFTSEKNKGTTFWFSLPKTGMKPKEGAISLS